MGLVQPGVAQDVAMVFNSTLEWRVEINEVVDCVGAMSCVVFDGCGAGCVEEVQHDFDVGISMIISRH